jgi:hypothetical protein
MKRKNASSNKKSWRNLKYILTGEWSRSERAMPCMIPALWHSKNDKTIKILKRLVFGGRDE